MASGKFILYAKALFHEELAKYEALGSTARIYSEANILEMNECVFC